MRDFQLPGRSTVHALDAMAATSQPAATLAAIETLRRGGNAVDAAITAVAVLCVVEPQSTGLGGGSFALYAPGGGDEIVAVNGSGRAPAAATPEWYLDRGIDRIALQSPHAVTVPGAVDAWARLLADHGTMGFDEVLAPAIGYAEEGYVVHPRVARDWARNADKLKADPTAAAVYLPGGRAPRAGEVQRQPMLAETLRTIAREGRDGFYTGRVAEDIVSYLRGLGGLHSLEDFAAQESEVVRPIVSQYRGYDVYQPPPNGPGVTVLMMLNVLEGFDLSALDALGVERLHLEAEAARLAYNAREEYVGDPRQVEVPLEKLLSKDFAAEMRAKISLAGAMDLAANVPPAHPSTVYLSVVDRERNAISLIASLAFAFGSGLVSPNTGVTLQNRGVGFRLEPGHPNCIAPGKRPLDTNIPAMVAREGRVVMPFGVMGGQFQPMGQSHVLSNIVDFAMDPQAAIDCPRGFHYEGVYQLEKGIGEKVAAGLEKLGHRVARAEHPLGGGQAIWIDGQRGVLAGASDPRKDGCALGT